MKNRIGMLAVLLVSGLVLAGMVNIIGIGSTFKGKPDINVVFNLAQFLPPANDGEPARTDDSGAKRFLSLEDLNAFIKYAAYANRVSKENADFETVDTAGSGASDHSTTNIQVEGVDEADVVKNDGRYIYVVSGRKVVIVDAYPAEDAEILSEIEFDEQPSEIFINEDKLVVFTQEYINEDGRSPTPYYYGSTTKTNVVVYDISNRKKPKVAREIKADGNYFDSRMIGDYVYVIINEPVYYRPCPVYDSVILEGVGEFIAGDCVEESITAPKVTIDGEETGDELPDIYYWDAPDTSYHFTTILAINTQDDKEKPGRKIFLMGDAQNMFVSLGNIYVTRTKGINDYEVMEEVYDEIVIPGMPRQTRAGLEEIESSNKSFNVKRLERAEVVREYIANLDKEETSELYEQIDAKTILIMEEYQKSSEQTAINKIAINKGKITPKASGSVPGTVLNQFSMDEYAGNFRIATTVGWNGDNNVYVLDEDLDVIGELEGLAPGESIYSARFMGSRCYLVTFKKIDPLFVIDMSDPKNPKVLGKLKIPGYSDYLHPYDENHLIGIGKETVEAEEGDFAWYQGVKISLFDVTDVEKPKEIDKYEIGDRGTDSYALQDHKAFLFSKSKNLLVIPILLAEIDEEKYPRGVSANTYGDFVWQGAYVFELTLEDGFELKGRVTHADAGQFLKSGYYYGDDSTSVKRSLYMDDTLYTISDKKIKMNYLRGLGDINEVDISCDEEGYIDDGEIILAKKPAVYLYPREDSAINVTLVINGKLTKTEPEYGGGWQVFATKEGIIDGKYDYLFWEANLNKLDLPDEGWVVGYADLEGWFDTNLPKLGLNEKEKAQFMEYWLEKLPKAKYYEIKLLSGEFMKQNMDLIVSPKPDTVIRLNFQFKPLSEKIELSAPEIETPKRAGFTVVEWGGILGGDD